MSRTPDLMAKVSLLRAAEEVFAENGLDAAKVEDIARRAGLSKGAVYLYFKARLPAGITWTAYTHAGCGWLTFGLFLSSVVLGFIFWRKLNFHPKSDILKRIAYVWIVQNAVLALGTLRRIHMYIDYSGLTHLLLWLLRRYIAAFATGLLVLVITPHGLVCATYNVSRILKEKPHATWPVVLKELPADAMPPIVSLLDYHRKDGDISKEKLVREGIAAILGQHLVRLEQEEDNSWSQWQASSWFRQNNGSKHENA